MEVIHSNTMTPSDEAAGNEQAIKIEVLDTPNISVVPFAVSLPQSKLQDLGASSPKQSMPLVLCENGIVGSVVLLKNSAIVWVGWGTIDPRSSDYEMGEASKSPRFGTGAPVLGQVLVSFPRTSYQGAFGTGSKEPSCSQIVGSASSDDQMLATQMASRLTTRSGIAVFVSCQLSSPPDPHPVGGIGESLVDGIDSEMISHRAAALAEKEIWKIIQGDKE